MQVIVIRPKPSRHDSLVAELWEHGVTGILEEDAIFRAYFPDSFDVSGIVASENGEIIDSFIESERPVYQASEANSEPVYLGRRFVVLSGPGASETDPSLIPLFLPSSEAFGSGRHESTQLMVEAMESCLQPGSAVVDVGCGSGILCAVAEHLGASTIIACDTHTDAVSSARQTCSKAAAFVGSVDAMQPSTAAFVLANISAKVIDALAAELVRVAKPDGLIFLSGFIQDRTPARFQPETVLERNGWLCWICRPELLAASSAETIQAIQPFEAQWW